MTTLAMRKPHADRGIEGVLAKWYAVNTGEMMNQYVDLARRISNQIPPGSAVLEVAPGPGYFSIELAKLGSYAITGLDISHSMVKIASKKADEAGVCVDFKQGSAAKMPLQRNSFDFLLCRAAFKNFAQPAQALREMRRVLRPGGRALIIDLRRDVSMREINRYVDSLGLGFFSRWFTSLSFRFMLLRRAYTVAGMQQLLAPIGFASTRIDTNAIGMEIWLEK